MKKRYLGRIILGTILTVFVGAFIAGKNGIAAIFALKRNNTMLVRQNEALKEHIVALEYRLSQWANEPFFKEQYAREKLQLAYPEDHVYYLM